MLSKKIIYKYIGSIMLQRKKTIHKLYINGVKNLVHCQIWSSHNMPIANVVQIHFLTCRERPTFKRNKY